MLWGPNRRFKVILLTLLCLAPANAMADPDLYREVMRKPGEPWPPADEARFSHDATCASRSVSRWMLPQPTQLEAVRCDSLPRLDSKPPGQIVSTVEEVPTEESHVSHDVSSHHSRVIRLFDFSREGRPLYVLGDRFNYCVKATGKIISVPPGFVTDFASIPTIARGFLPPDGPYARAAIIHDFLYAVGAPGQRKEADDILMAAMVEYGVSVGTRQIIYSAVRLGGGRGYGLSSDWSFVDPLTLLPRRAPNKPATGAYSRGAPGCRDFVSWEREIDYSLRDGLSDYVRQINDEELRAVEARRTRGG